MHELEAARTAELDVTATETIIERTGGFE
jgi:hypothetical protein